MTVYVDDMEARFQRMVMCHMWADTLGELIAMANVISLPTKWIQHPPHASWVHFDISKTKRAEAVAHGAVEKRWRDAPLFADAQVYNVSYAKFYESHWKYATHRLDYATGTLTRKEPKVHAANDWLDDDIPF